MSVVSFSGLHHFAADYHLLGDFFDFFCGAELGEGTSRTVYEFRLDPMYVIKIQRTEKDKTAFQNVSEFDTWTNINGHHKELAKFLAPCWNISSCGRVLLMRKTEKIKDNQRMPKKIPEFLSDTKTQNWGVIEGKVVCHDYANNHVYSKVTTKLVTPKWWSDRHHEVLKIK